MSVEFEDYLVEDLFMDDDGQLPFFNEIGNKSMNVSVLVDGQCWIVLEFAYVHVDPSN